MLLHKKKIKLLVLFLVFFVVCLGANFSSTLSQMLNTERIDEIHKHIPKEQLVQIKSYNSLMRVHEITSLVNKLRVPIYVLAFSGLFVGFVSIAYRKK